MSTDNLPKNPEILKLLKSFETMPQYLEERRKKIQAQKEFARYVFEDAVRQSGMMERLKRRKLSE